MSVAKIALGVFLGMAAVMLLAWLVLSVAVESRTNADNARQAHQRLETLQRQQ